MKYPIWIFFLLFLVPNIICSEINLAEIKTLAENNARQLWNQVNAYEPIPYYNLDDEIVAWRFNFALREDYPAKDELEKICRENYQEKQQENITDGSYGRILVGGDTDYPVFLDYSQCLSQEFAQGWKAVELAENHSGQSAELEKMYFINRFDLWYCFQADTEKIYVKLYPPQKVCNEEEFRQLTEYSESFSKRSDHSQSWADYLSGQKNLTRNEYYIDHHEMVPYYDWSYGCSPTAATMALAYWDNISVINDQNFALLVEYHFQRYDNIQVEWDYQVPDLQRELAIAMETDTISTGLTAESNIAPGITIVTNDIYNYDFNISYDTTGDLFNSVISQIVLNRTCIVSEPGHSNCGVGYNSDTNHAAVHNTHTSTIDWLSEDLIDAVIRIIPGGGYGQGINLVHPRGDVGYNSDGNGETLLAGAVYEIAWQNDSEYRDQVSIWFSIIGNGGAAQQYVAENAPNNREFDWVVPDWINSTSARIGIGLYNESDAKLGGDSSLGNFIISPGGSIPELTSGNSIVSNREPQYFRFSNSLFTWAVVGVRKMVNSDDEDWNIRLFSDAGFDTELVGSFLSSYNQVDFVVLDGRHTPFTERGIKIFRPMGSGEARVEYEGAREDLYYGTNGPFNWTAGEDVVKMWDIALTPGHYYIIMEPNGGGNANLDMAIFGSNDEPYFGNRLDAIASSTYLGTDISETIAIEITETDVYGLCVWANDEYSKNYNIRIEQPGTWKGVVSDYWYDAENWSGGVIPNTTTDIVIPAGTPYDIRLVDSGANCHDMTIMADARVEIYNCWLNVYGDLEVRGELEMTSNQAKMVVEGDIIWQEGAIADFQAGSSEIWVRGDWYFERNSSIHLDLGYVEFDGAGNSEIICRSDDSYFHHLRSDKDSGNWVGNSDNSTYPLVINGNFYNYADSYFIGWSLNSTIFRGSFNNNTGAQFEYPNGTVRFEGANQHINFNTGDYFNDLVIAGSVYLDTGIIIEDDLLIESGYLVSNNNTIEIIGDWTNEVGVGAFGEGTGIVNFNGYGTQRINGETFAILRINKSNGELRFTTGTSQCNYLDWLDGSMRVNGGEFTALNINTSSLEHDLTVTSGRLEIHRPSGYLDINNNFTISGGEVHIVGASTSDSYWGFSASTEISISGGILDYHDTGIRVCDNYLLIDNITDGVIRTTGDFSSERMDFDIAGGTLELYGNIDAELDMIAGSSLHNLTINKSAVLSRNDAEAIITRYNRRTGLISERQRSENVVALNNLDINGDFTLIHGNLEAPTFMRVAGNWTNLMGPDFFDEGSGAVIFDGDQNSNIYHNEEFYNIFLNKDIVGNNTLFIESDNIIEITNTLQVADGRLEAGEGVTFYLENELKVEDGGFIYLNGLSANPCIVSSSSGNYSFKVRSGGTISAEHTEFENMNSVGINIMDGASVIFDKAFNNCQFSSGESGGTLLTIDNNQNLNIYEAVFPSDFLARGTNVTKNLDQGLVNFHDAEGSFAGEDFDNDPYNRVDWLHRADLEITSVTWSDPDPYAGDVISCQVVVKNNWLGYSVPCFLDLYFNQSLPPEMNVPGDKYFYLEAIAPGDSLSVLFAGINYFTPTQWVSWLQVDTDQNVNENNENNNVWGPDNINWLPLPAVEDLNIYCSNNRDNDVYINWTYPISVSRFEIYGDMIPEFEISPETLLDNTITLSYLGSMQSDKFFFKIIAVRDSTLLVDPVDEEMMLERKFKREN